MPPPLLHLSSQLAVNVLDAHSLRTLEACPGPVVRRWSRDLAGRLSVTRLRPLPVS